MGAPGGDTGYQVNSKAPSWGNPGGTLGSTHAPQNSITNTDPIGGGVIGGGTIGSGNVHRSGSSALASMLGINLPTGSGSLRESTTQLWTSGSTPQAPIAALNGSSLPLQGVIGGTAKSSNSPIGGVAIGGSNQQIQAAANGSNSSDIALLQSLLPGVHITSGGSFQGSGFGSIGSSSNINSSTGPHLTSSGSASLAGNDTHQGFSLQPSLVGQPIGTIGHGTHSKSRQAPPPGSIW